MECGTDVDKILETCLDPSGRCLITDQTIYFKTVSDYMVYCERFVPENKKDPMTEFQKMVFEQSKIHKQCVIEKKYGKPEIKKYKSHEKGFRILLERMSEGTEVLCAFPAFYMPENLKGTFDILEKRDSSRSRFGDYHYVVKKIITAKKENLQDHHKLQGAFDNYLLGKIQEYTPPEFYIIDMNHEETCMKYEDCKGNLEKELREIREILGGREVTPTYGCEWPWRTYGNERAVAVNDVSLVRNVGEPRKKSLARMGIITVNELSNADCKDVAKINGIGPKTAQDIIQKAKALADGRIIYLGPCAFPQKDTEIFLDIENISGRLYFCKTVEIDYLIGVVTRTGGKTEYIPFIAHQLDKEGETFCRFIEWIKGRGECTLYHFSPHEKTRLGKLSDRYEFSKKYLEILFRNMIDLGEVATSSFVFPTYRDDLKHMARFFGYRWKHVDVDANECTALYLQYIKDPGRNRDKLRKILDYNEDDCRALMYIRDWLQKMPFQTKNTID